MIRKNLRSVLTSAINLLKRKVTTDKVAPSSDDTAIRAAEERRRAAAGEIRQLRAIRAGRNKIQWYRAAGQANAIALQLRAKKAAGIRTCRHVKRAA